MTKIIGLTGSFGSGKSTVARFLRELGAVIIDTDRIAHEVYKPGTEVCNAIVNTFGREILTHAGKIDRSRLGAIVFHDPEALKRLNGMTHPRIYEIVMAKIAAYRKRNVPVVVIDAPLLIEAEWTSLADQVWVTTAPEPEVLERVRKQRRMSDEDIAVRIHSRLPAGKLMEHADVVLNNEGGRDALKKRVIELWTELTSGSRHG